MDPWIDCYMNGGGMVDWIDGCIIRWVGGWMVRFGDCANC